MREAVLDSELQSSLIDIGNHDSLRTLHLCYRGTKQSNGSCAEDNHRAVFGHQTPSVSVQCYTQGLQQSTDIQTQILWQLVAPLCRVIYPLLQRPLEMWEALSTTSEPQR
jgi:hypothetical protein